MTDINMNDPRYLIAFLPGLEKVRDFIRGEMELIALTRAQALMGYLPGLEISLREINDRIGSIRGAQTNGDGDVSTVSTLKQLPAADVTVRATRGRPRKVKQETTPRQEGYVRGQTISQGNFILNVLHEHGGLANTELLKQEALKSEWRHIRHFATPGSATLSVEIARLKHRGKIVRTGVKGEIALPRGTNGRMGKVLTPNELRRRKKISDNNPRRGRMAGPETQTGFILHALRAAHNHTATKKELIALAAKSEHPNVRRLTEPNRINFALNSIRRVVGHGAAFSLETTREGIILYENKQQAATVHATA